MAKSLRSKTQRRLRTLRRELAQPFYDKKEVAKLAAQEAALAAPKLPVRVPKNREGDEMVSEADASTAAGSVNAMEVEMVEAGSSKTASFFKPGGGIGKKSRKKQKGKRGKGKYNKKQHF